MNHPKLLAPDPDTGYWSGIIFLVESVLMPDLSYHRAIFSKRWAYVPDRDMPRQMRTQAGFSIIGFDGDGMALIWVPGCRLTCWTGMAELPTEYPPAEKKSANERTAVYNLDTGIQLADKEARLYNDLIKQMREREKNYTHSLKDALRGLVQLGKSYGEQSVFTDARWKKAVEVLEQEPPTSEYE